MAIATQEGGASVGTGVSERAKGRGPSPEQVTRWSLRCFLAVDALLLAGYLLADGGYLLSILDGSPQFPLITNSVGLYLLLLCCAALALADIHRFRVMLLFIAAAHIVQVVSLVLVVALHGLSGDVSILQLFDVPAAAVFAAWTVYAIAIAALFFVLYRWAPAAEVPMPFERELGWPQKLLQGALGVMGVVFIAFIVLYLARGIAGKADFTFVAASVSKDGLFLALALLALRLPARWASLTLVVVVGHLALVVSNAALLSSVEGTAPDLGGDGVRAVLIWMGADLVVIAGLLAALWVYQRARYRLDYLWPPSVRALEAFADALFANVPDAVPPRTVAETVDDYLGAFKGRAKWKVQAVLALLYYLPIGWRLAPFTALSRESRLDWAQQRFDRADVPSPLRGLRRGVRSLIRGAQQFAYVGYYSLPEGWEPTGFQPFTEREDAAEKIATVSRRRRDLDVIEPWEVGGRELEADVVIVGSGAAGAILAYRLAEAGRDVVVLERGPHIRPWQITEDEMEMFAKLYKDGALQFSRDFAFQVAQGQCVGGSTTVNNAVCIEPSDQTKEEWQGLVPDLDLDQLNEAFDEVRRLLHVDVQPNDVRTLAATELTAGLAASGRAAEPVQANIAGCFGCGYCNSGCPYGKKLSMLDSVLLWGQQQFGARLKIVSECEARRIQHRRGRARAVKCRLSDGRRIRVNAREKVIVSAGAIASSRLLQRSLIAFWQAGKGLTFNLRTALAAEFPAPVYSWAGLQMTDAYRPDGETRWMIESWSVPVVSQALAMPGWFGDHEENMANLARIGWAGVLVGAETRGRVRRLPPPWASDEFDFTPREPDLTALKDAFQTAAEALFQANAEKVMVSTQQRLVVSRNGNPAAAAAKLRDRLDELVDESSDMLNLGSSHPQGGNSMSSGPESGVVDADCRVHSHQNLYVCDASVFPTSVTVNPQLTVMALGQYAAKRMLGAAGKARPRRD
jgi:choline dehydrogenase-like flavoprotein